MILTYKYKHNLDLTTELSKAKQVALFAITNKDKLTSKYVKHIGLKSIISNQILRKYGRNKKIKQVRSVNLIIPNQGIKVNKDSRQITIPCLKISFSYFFDNNFEKVNQIEINNNYIFVSVEYQNQPEYIPETTLGIDRNTTGHCVVAAIPETGKVFKLGKSAEHIHKKYKYLRRFYQKTKLYKKLGKIKHREKNKVKDLNHKISKKIVETAKVNKAIIVLEDIKNIRKSKKQRKSFRYSLNSWSYYQLEQMIIYKAKLLGVPIAKVAPQYTSQQCSKCGLLGKRNDKEFKCPHCGHVEHADVNAAFVIALRHKGVVQLPVDRDIGNGCTDQPQEATA